MIIVKTPEQIKLMRIAGRITGEALLLGGEMVKPGVSTKQIDDKIRHYIEKCGAKQSFLGYGGFPGSACISINQEIIHGIPSAHTRLPRRQREHLPLRKRLRRSKEAHRGHKEKLGAWRRGCRERGSAYWRYRSRSGRLCRRERILYR